MSKRSPSRKERRESKFYFLAEKGRFESDTTLYKTEEKILEKRDGFAIISDRKTRKEAAPSKVSWENPYKGNIPPLVNAYISGEIKTFPDLAIENWAQELYVIASRVNYKKANDIVGWHKENE